MEALVTVLTWLRTFKQWDEARKLNLKVSVVECLLYDGKSARWYPDIALNHVTGTIYSAWVLSQNTPTVTRRTISRRSIVIIETMCIAFNGVTIIDLYEVHPNECWYICSLLLASWARIPVCCHILGMSFPSSERELYSSQYHPSLLFWHADSWWIYAKLGRQMYTIYPDRF